MSTLPLSFASPNWFTTKFIAARLGRDITTIQKWIRSGLLLKRGYVVVMTMDRGGKRYWVKVDSMSRDGLLKRVPLETLDKLSTNIVD